MIAAAAWTLYFLLPVGGWGLFSGRPLGVIGGTVLLALWWGVVFHGLAQGLRLAVALVAIKLVLGVPLLVDHGFVAAYYANDRWAPPDERSVDFLTAVSTRLDDRLEFRPPDRLFPLHFFNDFTRFNFYGSGDHPDRERLPLSVAWTGWIRRATAGTDRFSLRVGESMPPRTPAQWARDYTPHYLSWVARHALGTDANDPTVRQRYTDATLLGALRHDPRNAGRDVSGGSSRAYANLEVNGRPAAAVEPGQRTTTGEVALEAGWHRIEIRFASPYDAARELSATHARRGRERPLDGTEVYAAPVAEWRRVLDRIVRAGSWLLIYPLYVALLPYSGLALARLAAFATRDRGPAATAVAAERAP